MQKVNKTHAKRAAVQKVYEAFIAGGFEYTCPACFNEVRNVALEEAKNLLSRGINLSKGKYAFSFTDLMAGMFLSGASEMYYNLHFKKK